MAEDLKNIGRHEIAPHQGAIRGTNQIDDLNPCYKNELFY
jgi:hypothetical protein